MRYKRWHGSTKWVLCRAGEAAACKLICMHTVPAQNSAQMHMQEGLLHLCPHVI